MNADRTTDIVETFIRLLAVKINFLWLAVLIGSHLTKSLLPSLFCPLTLIPNNCANKDSAC